MQEHITNVDQMGYGPQNPRLVQFNTTYDINRMKDQNYLIITIDIGKMIKSNKLLYQKIKQTRNQRGNS